MVKEGRYIQLLAAFSRALGHQLRTPLSVVTNELAYVASKHPSEDLSRATERCRSVVSVLQQAVVPGGSICDPVRVALGSVTEVLKKNGFFVAEQPGSGVMLRIDEQKFDFLVRQIGMLCGLLKREGSNENLPTVSISHDEIQIQFRFPLSTVIDLQPMDSCSQFFHQGIGANSVVPAMIDAVVWSHGATLTICGGPQSYLTIQFPRI